ncbi:S-adenosyl-L-methionine-dependent methyltransferase [Entophlyctis helioformis]|nr:S-adenosyl-L-methionine-dependent methyltransferase [Entophlyctis helioformis]
MAARKGLLLVSAAGLYSAVAYGSYTAYRVVTAPAAPEGCQDPRCQRPVRTVYDSIAPAYDASIGWDEWMMGLARRRSELLGAACGDTLEVSAGTGRNFAAYRPSQMTSLTITDASVEMLKQAFAKYKAEGLRKAFMPHLRPPPPPTTAPAPATATTTSSAQPAASGHEQHDAKAGTRAVVSTFADPAFTVMNSERLLYPARTFDTVVDTFGLCSHSDPVGALREMGRVCRPGGRILLLEHGRSELEWVNTMLDKGSAEHADRWGCWWNRDILGIVGEAGLQVHEVKRYHFGTTYCIVAGPPLSASALPSEAASGSVTAVK